jgi:hypothetical protein
MHYYFEFGHSLLIDHNNSIAFHCCTLFVYYYFSSIHPSINHHDVVVVSLSILI